MTEHSDRVDFIHCSVSSTSTVAYFLGLTVFVVEMMTVSCFCIFWGQCFAFLLDPGMKKQTGENSTKRLNPHFHVLFFKSDRLSLGRIIF